jgi:hypothetical protein
MRGSFFLSCYGFYTASGAVLQGNPRIAFSPARVYIDGSKNPLLGGDFLAAGSV